MVDVGASRVADGLADLVGAAGALARSRGLDPAAIADIPGLPGLSSAPARARAPASVEEIGRGFELLLDDRPRGGELRKRSGTYFTARELTEPTATQALRRLLEGRCGGPAEPERILRLRVCDPAAGGGAFLLAVLRRITDRLDESMAAHDWLRADGTAGSGAPAWFRRFWALGRVRADPAVRRARLRSIVARRCLFGVDLDPHAVALARLAIWLEVADPELPPRRLARQIRCGDALIGAWPDQARSYPGRAFDRAAPGRAAPELDQWRREHRRALAGVHPFAPDDPDAWCALWFWPLEALDAAPEPGSRTAAKARRIVDELRRRLSFFHWTHEFRSVFRSGGFDLVLGNPPWDIRKPDSRAFFASHDPEYRRYGKQDALRAQQRMFAADPAIERAWLRHLAEHRAMAHFWRHAGSPFRNQGTADSNSYKLFLELGHALLRPGGVLAMIVPSGLYTDLGTTELRKLFLHESDWRLLLGIENRRRLFAEIDGRFKFCSILVRKGGRTRALRASFMRKDPSDWHAETPRGIDVDATTIERLSPRSLAILEIEESRDLEILERLHGSGQRFGDDSEDGWRIRFRRELDMTLDSERFTDRAELEARGFAPDLYSRWLLARDAPRRRRPPGERAGWLAMRDGRWIPRSSVSAIALPVYEGRMIGQFDFSEKGWVEGRGRRAVWRSIPPDEKTVEPQFLIDAPECARLAGGGPRIGIMAVGSATNRRSMIAASLADDPCGNAVPTLRCRAGHDLALLAVLNSFVYDYALRLRLGANNLNRFVLAETPLPDPGRVLANGALDSHVAALSWNHERFAARWLELRGERAGWRALWAITPHERLRRRCILDAVVAAAWGLSFDDLARILRDCHHPPGRLADRSFARELDQKGFWRIDMDRDPELRHPVLTLAAFKDLSTAIDRTGGDLARAAASFCGRDPEPGWMLPERLRLSELGLDGERTNEPRPVRARLGPRLTAAQRAATAEPSWRECREHAELLA